MTIVSFLGLNVRTLGLIDVKGICVQLKSATALRGGHDVHQMEFPLSRIVFGLKYSKSGSRIPSNRLFVKSKIEVAVNRLCIIRVMLKLTQKNEIDCRNKVCSWKEIPKDSKISLELIV